MSIKSIKPRYLLIFLTVLLLSSLLGNLWLYQELKKNYLALYQVQLNPLGIGRYSNNLKSELPAKPRVVLYGDSRAFQWKAPQMDNFQFINRAINGQTSDQVLWRFDTHVSELNPKVIVLQVGINDIRMLATAPKTREDIVKDCQNNIAQIIERANSIGADIIVTTIFPLGNGNIPLRLRPFWPSLSEMEQSINEVNQYIRSFSDRDASNYNKGVIVFDAYSLLNQEDRNKVKYYKDLLHINRKGYELLNQKLESILNNIDP
ncbi:MAG: GDSL-type esterase/lipase family protein [Xenococcaceae cyanobacterium MO_167.B27]|nr:GDSL-type esterase/lipase family protein [Xenococcaceae cyanobacterium MO_167.B27]